MDRFGDRRDSLEDLRRLFSAKDIVDAHLHENNVGHMQGDIRYRIKL